MMGDDDDIPKGITWRTPILGAGNKVNKVGLRAPMEGSQSSGYGEVAPRCVDQAYLERVAKDMGEDFAVIAPTLHARYKEYTAVTAWYKTQKLLGGDNE